MIDELPRTPALDEFLTNDPDKVVDRTRRLYDERCAAFEDEWGITVDEKRQFCAARDALTDADEIVALVLKTFTRECRPSSRGLAIASKMRDVTVECLRRAKEIAA